MGDPAGIGPEICEKALLDPKITSLANCLVIGDRKLIRQRQIQVIDLHNVPKNLKIGRVSAASGKASVEYVEKAIRLAMDGKIDAIVTCPINKEALNKAGYKYAGHTEILAARTKTSNYAMMFVSDTLWVMLVTIHLPLKEVSQTLNKQQIIKKIKLAHETLFKLKGKKPRIAVAGLNPHAGEAGLFGDEELKIIEPAVSEARKLGINVKGPLAPDSIFHLAHIGLFDIVIAMYHDQGLIPLKLLSFNNSVNVTVGLPIIRTSVDHGTGFEIVGQGVANASSLIEAIKVAARFAKS
jgi:4-hydroxythreonine-4-phosphate dehydrogenase